MVVLYSFRSEIWLQMIPPAIYAIFFSITIDSIDNFKREYK